MENSYSPQDSEQPAPSMDFPSQFQPGLSVLVYPHNGDGLIRGVIYDSDQTIFNNKRLIVEANQKAFLKVLGEEVAETDIEKAMGLHIPEFFERICPSFTKEYTKPILRETNAYLDKNFVKHAEEFLMPNLKPTFKQLKSEGYKLFVVSGTPHKMLGKALKHAGMSKYVDSHVGSGFRLYACEKSLGKPFPDTAKQATRGHMLAPESLAFVGDSPIDLEFGLCSECVSAIAYAPDSDREKFGQVPFHHLIQDHLEIFEKVLNPNREKLKDKRIEIAYDNRVMRKYNPNVFSYNRYRDIDRPLKEFGLPTLYVYDGDGTLWDTEASIADTVEKILKEDYGIKCDKDSLSLAMSRPMPDFLYACSPEVTPEIAAKFGEKLDRELDEQAEQIAVPMKNAALTLYELKLLGAKVAVLSGAPEKAVRKRLEVTKLARFVDHPIGSDTFPNLRSKPHADILEHLMKKYSLEAEDVAVIGNTQTDMEMARNSFCSIQAGFVKTIYGILKLSANDYIGGDHQDIFLAMQAETERPGLFADKIHKMKKRHGKLAK